MYPLAFSTLGCPAWTLAQAADAAVANGYAGLEIRLLGSEVIPADLSARQRHEVRQIVADRGLTIIGLGASTRFSAPAAVERRRQEDELRRYLDLAAELGAGMVRTFGGKLVEGATLEQTAAWLAGSLEAVMPAAEATGVTVMLETHDAFCRGQDVALVLAQIDHPRMQIIWDLHHSYRMGESIEETWQLIGSRVGHVHIKDAVRREDGTWQLVLLGQGEVPNRAAIDLLSREGYAGYLSVEWEKKWHPEIPDPEIALPQHARLLREWMN